MGEKNVQPDIDFGQGLAKVVRTLVLAREVLLGAVEGFKEGHDVALIGLSRGGEARLVDTVVDEVVLPLVGVFNVAAQRLGVNVNGTVLLVQQFVKLCLCQS